MFKTSITDTKIEKLSNQFLELLKMEGSSKKTLKNYKTDVKQFLLWKELYKVDGQKQEVLLEYYKHLTTLYKTASSKRKYFAVKKYLEYTDSISTSSDPMLSKTKKLEKSAFISVGLVAIAIAVFVFTPTVARPFSDAISNSSIESDTFVRVNTKPTTISISPTDFAESKDIRIVLGENLNNTESSVASYQTILNPILEASPAIEKTSGQAVIEENKKETILVNENISESSLLFITPLANPGSGQLFISKQGDGFAIVEITENLTYDLGFNYLVVQEEMYQSIF